MSGAALFLCCWASSDSQETKSSNTIKDTIHTNISMLKCVKTAATFSCYARRELPHLKLLLIPLSIPTSHIHAK